MSRDSVIVLLNLSYYPDVKGAERQMQLLAERLASHGQAVCVLTRRHPDRPHEESVNGVQVYRLWCIWFPLLSWITFAWSVRRFVSARRGRIQVIGSFMFNMTAFAAAAGACAGRVPVFIRSSASGSGGNVEVMQRSLLGRWRARRLLAASNGCVALNNATVAEFRQLGVPDRRIHKIPNAVDTDFFKPAALSERATLRERLQLKPQDVAVVFVGRLVEQKNLTNLLRVWPRVVERNSNARLLIVGDGPLRESLQRMGRDSAANSTIRWLGEQASALDFYRAGDLFTLPSWFEGLSNAMLEAMSCALPVVASNIPGNNEVIVPGENGTLIEPSQPDEWVESLSRLIQDQSLRERWGQQARRHVEQQYSVQAMVGAYEKLFKDLTQ